MNVQGYGLPTYSGYPAYLRAYLSATEPHPKDYYVHRRNFSLGSVSLSDERHPENMPCWFRTQSIGIDVALRNLNHEATASPMMLQELVQCFESDVEPLRPWVEEYTLDTVWRNKVKEKIFETRNKMKFDGNCKALKEASEDRYRIERQIWIAKKKKKVVFCDGILELAGRAASERLACKQLVTELVETNCLLNPRKHPWICKHEIAPSRHRQSPQPIGRPKA
ncbi:hypothetical protein C7999DRAFT_40770 [Corynascus novoguineensis]|uniref:Uncharacterized protein n=1 Tax=Corynascus novoguineensis TaxID=1126955 RepID=A0AAN7CTE8_9PEZI|nr:hypothetical protein C7999DRAFT_40770 [Corynascus novoguineensis]